MNNVITLLLSWLFVLYANGQTVYTVDNSNQSGAQFTNLQSAIDGAIAGDIIYIHPSSTSYGNVSVDKPLSLIGLGHNPDNINGETANLNLLFFNGNAGGSKIKGLVLVSISSGSIGNSTDLSNMSISNNRFNGTIVGSLSNNLSNSWVIEGNYFTSTSSNVTPQLASDNWLVKNNFLRGRFTTVNDTCTFTNNLTLTIANAFSFFSGCENPTAKNNIFVATAGLTEIGIGQSTVNFMNNLTYNFSGLTIDTLTGTDNLDNTDPLFVNVPMNSETDFYSNDYGLSINSLGVNAGTDGTDIGLFGNNFMFDTNGRPSQMPYPESMNIINSTVAPGQILSVEFKAAQKQ